MTETARPFWEASRDPRALQQFLKDHGCNGIDAVFTTKALLACTLHDAQAAFFMAPCRAAELEFQNQAMEALASIADSEVASD